MISTDVVQENKSPEAVASPGVEAPQENELSGALVSSAQEASISTETHQENKFSEAEVSQERKESEALESTVVEPDTPNAEPNVDIPSNVEGNGSKLILL